MMTMTTRHNRNLGRGDSAGFTLIELLVVIALVGLLAVLIAPSISSWQRHANLKADVRRLYGFVQKARMEAVKINGNCSVTFLAKTVTISCIDPPVNSFTLESDVSFSPLPSTITFGSRGLPAAGQTLTLVGKNGNTHSLIMNSRGHVRVE